ncbi:MAG: hypothetical protein KatS3mg111_1010 [Pirellulaceae bacterium]|nr:MAG: hypothetical protein KatS3mg111_1010 [Pirellulaceae bacterium]
MLRRVLRPYGGIPLRNLLRMNSQPYECFSGRNVDTGRFVAKT